MTSDSKTPKDKEEIGHLEAILEQDPASPKFYRLADAYTREGRFLDAIRLSKQGLKHHPEHARGYVALGRALFGSGNLPKAVKVLWKSLDLQVTESEPFRLLGEILLWQTAPTEAVTVLERAVALGYDEPSIQNVLQRAMDAVEREKTGIVEHLQQKKRGIGNVAVAGTIGTTSHGFQGPLTAEITRRVAFPQEFADSETTAVVQGGAFEAEEDSEPEVAEGPTAAGGGAGWNTIDSEWSHQLDVQELPSFPDIDSDVQSGQRSGHQDSMPLAPLMDPLEEGIPPVPLDAIDTGETLLPLDPEGPVATFGSGADEAQTTGSQLPPVDSARTTVAPLIPTGAGEQDRSGEGPAHADTVPAMHAVGPEHAETQQMSRLTPAREEEPHTGTYEGPGSGAQRGPEEDSSAAGVPWGEPTDPSPAAHGEELELLAAMSGGSAGSAEELTETDPPLAPELDDHFDAAEDVLPPRRRRRRGSSILWMLLVLLLIGLGAGSFLLWRHISHSERNRDALQAARRARVSDTFETYQEVLAKLERIRARGGDSQEVLGAIELLSALQWLTHGAGNPPTLTRGAGTSTHTLARATLALANGEPWRVRTILAAFKGDQADRALAALLSGWASWLEGDGAEALGQLKRSAAIEPLAGALLLQGHLHRELGDHELAAAAYREALKLSPRHALANLGMAAVLLEGRAALEQIDEHLARPVESPVEKAWHKVLRNEYKILRGNPGGETHDLLVELNMTPPDPALLFQAIRVLMFAGQFDAAHAMLSKLKKVRSERDSAMVLLESELFRAQGLEARALELIGTKPTLRQHRLSRAAALLWNGQPDEALAAMGKGEDETRQLYRMIAELLQDPQRVLAPLEAQAKAIPQAKLALATVLAQRGAATRAQEVVSELVNVPRYRLRALTLRATIYFEAGNLVEALSNLGVVQRSSPQYMPALELLGRIHLETGRYQEAAELLGKVHAAGRRTLPLVTALIKARALTGNATAAAPLMAEIKALGASAAQRALLGAHLRLSEGKLPGKRLSAEQLKDRDFLLALAARYHRAGKPDLSERLLKSAIALDPQHPLAHLRMGQLYFEDDLKIAISYFKGAIERTARLPHYHPSIEAEAHLGMAAALLEQRKSGKRVTAHLNAAIKRDPSSSRAFQLRGRNLLLLKRWKSAQEALEKSVLLDPENASAYYLLGTSVRSPRKRAAQALKRFLELEPKGERAAQARRQLGGLR